MTNEIMAYEGALTSRDLKARVNLIQDVMRSVMKEDVHFGIIPGCPKPSLYKPGAEVLNMTFSINVESSVEDLSSQDEKRYRVMCTAYSAAGVKLGSAVGECSSGEEKYKWRRPACDEEYEATEFDRKREKWTREGKKIKQIRTEPSDQANTILQMADKRAYVAVTRKVTAASDIFTQDIEQMENPPMDAEVAPSFKKPQPILNTADFKEIQSKFDGKCKSCEGGINKGETVMYNPKLKGVYHPDCLKPKEEPAPATPAPAMTKGVLTNLEKMAKEAGVKLLDRVGRDGLQSLDDIKPEYAQELLAEFAGIIDEREK